MTLTDTPWPRFDGELILADDPRFEAARIDRIFNRRLTDRLPAAVLKAGSEADVVAGVRLARERGWQVAVRSGGHSWAQWSIRENALVIDLGALQEMEYAEETGIVSASPAVQGGQTLDPFLAEHGRFFNGGHCPTVGIGGFLLQGGQGWNARGWGWAAESIVAIDVVTADGELVRASENENADLFWAARGAGPGFFGVVTRFHLRTRPRPKHFVHHVAIYDLSHFDTVMTWLHETHAQVADCVEIVALTRTEPAISGQPVLLVTAVAFVDTLEAGREALAPFLACPHLGEAIVVKEAEDVPLSVLREDQIHANPEGHRWRVDNAWLTGSAAQVVPAMRDAFVTLPNAQAFTIWFSMAPLRELPDMAFSMQSEIYLASYVLWPEDTQDDACRDWLAGVMAQLEPVTAGQYLGDSDLAHRQVRFMAPENHARLLAIARERDPEGMFVGYLAGEGGATNRNHWED